VYPDDFAQVAAVEGYEIPSVPRRGSAGNGYACRAGITKRISPHRLRHTLITAGLDAGVPLRDVQDAASHPQPPYDDAYDRARQSLDRYATCIVAASVAGAAR
jgi:integrase/recombinase XerD